MQVRSSANVDKIYQALLSRIRSGEFAVGTVLPTEAVLAEQYGGGRHVVAQALNRLAHDGLVERKKRAGTRVLRKEQEEGRVELDAVAFVYPSDLHEGIRRIQHGFQEMAHDAKCRVVTLSTGMDRKKEVEMVGRLGDFGVKGVVAYPVLPSVEDRLILGQMLSSSDLPTVLAGVDLPGFSSYSVILDGFHAGWAMTNHLLKQGLKRIGFFSDYAWTTAARESQLGYRHALEAAGVAGEPGWMLLDDSIEPDFEKPLSVGDDMVRKYLIRAKSLNLEGVVCSDDFLALKCLQMAGEMGLSVPKRFKVVGVSDYELSGQSKPSLTTYHVSFEEIGRSAFRLLSQLLSGDKPETSRLQVRGSIVVRQSG